jgi:hypothetical protein
MSELTIMIGFVQNQETDSTAENRFQMNLLRLAGKTEILTIDVIFEVIAFISYNGIADLHLVEEEYLSCFFNDDIFMGKIQLYISSFPMLVQRYEEARRTNNGEELEAFKVAHRIAKQFLADPETKERIKSICHQRASLNQYRSYIHCMQVLLNYSQEFYHHTSAREVISQFIPMFSQNVPILGDQIEGNKSDGNIIEMHAASTTEDRII